MTIDPTKLLPVQYEMLEEQNMRANRPAIPEMTHYDVHPWDADEERELSDHAERLAFENGQRGVIEFLMSHLSEDEKHVVHEHIWNGHSFYYIGNHHARRDKDGNHIILGWDTHDDGSTFDVYAYHDVKWAKRKWASAIRKMRRASADIPFLDRAFTTYAIPSTTPMGDIAERIASEQGESAGDSARVLVRQAFQRSRLSQPPTR